MLNGFDIENSKEDDDIDVDENDLMQFLGQLDGGQRNDEAMEEELVETTPLVPEVVRRPPPPVVPRNIPQEVPRSLPQTLQPSILKPVQQTPSLFEQVKARQLEYKKAALKAKNEGDKQQALLYLRQSKEIDSVILKIENGESVDMSSLPPSLASSSTRTTNLPSQLSNNQFPPSSSSNVPRAVPNFDNNTTYIEDLPEVSQETAAQIFNAPTSASSIMEALQQRLEKFQATHKKALAANETAKIRRLGRIVKSYETAIRDHKAGKPLELDALPCPPGFPPFPTEGGNSSAKPAEPMPVQVPPAAQNRPQSQAIEKSAPSKPNPGTSGSNKVGPKGTRPQLKRGTSTIGDKQLRFLMERQKLFKQAALEAYKRKEVEQAKEYMRQAKGFDPLIEATMSGLPIDATSIPVPPQIADNDFVIVDQTQVPQINAVGEAKFYTGDEREELFRELERDLLSQIEVSLLYIIVLIL